jgi:hypothetical protein
MPGKNQSFSSKAVKMRSLDIFFSVAPKLRTKIIDTNEKNIGAPIPVFA